MRTVVWVTPWVNLESIDGQRPPDAESERLHTEPAENYAEGAEAGHYVRAANGDPYVGRWWMGTGSIVDFTSVAARDWWRELSRNVFELGVEGVKADDGEGYYFPPDAELAMGAWACRPRGTTGAFTARRLSRRSTTSTARDAAWSSAARAGPASGHRDALGRRPGLGLLVAPRPAHLAADLRRHRLLQPLPRRRRLPRPASGGALRARAARPLGTARRAHSADAGTWPLPAGGMDLRRTGPGQLPRGGPPARAARPLHPSHRRDRGAQRAADHAAAVPGRPGGSGGLGDRRLLHVRPLTLGRPVLEEGATERRTYLPRGEWFDWWTGERTSGGRWIDPRLRSSGSRCGSAPARWSSPTPSEEVARGLGEEDPSRALEATLWGEPVLGHTSARLADGTHVAWRRGEWSVSPDRSVRFVEPPDWPNSRPPPRAPEVHGSPNPRCAIPWPERCSRSPSRRASSTRSAIWVWAMSSPRT